MRKNKGITLIALIITIVIMLILVAVSVNIIINSNIIGQAEKAAEGYKTAYEQESNIGQVTIGGKTYNSIEDYLAEQGPKEHNFQYTDNSLAELKCECEECKKANSTGRIYKIGQQIKLTDSDTLLTDTSAATGTEWVVFGREDSNKDGKYETLLITTLAPSTEKLTLGEGGNKTKSADAYNTGIEQIEAKVKEIYGNDVRAMTIDDVNKTLGYTPAGGMYYDTNGNLTTTGNFTTKLKDLGDVWTDIVNYNTNNNAGVFYTPAHPEGISDNGAELGEYLLDGYWYAVNSSVGGTGEPTVSENTSNVAKNLVFGTSGNKYSYCLASRGAYVCGTAAFGPGYVGRGHAYSYNVLFDSNGSTFGYVLSARALVSLKSEIPELGEVLVSSEAWS